MKIKYLYIENGTFIKQIDEQGRGPNEYQNIDDVDIFEKAIYILDRSSKKILVFNLLGNFIKI